MANAAPPPGTGRRIATTFVNGLFVLTPAAATIWLGLWLLNKLDKPLRDWLTSIVELPYPPYGVGLLATIIVIYLTGLLAQNFLTRGLWMLMDNTLAKAPLLKLVYNSVKDMMQAFVGEKKRFDKPCWVTVIPDSDVRVAGFMTRDNLELYGLPGHVSVYVPQSYNFAAQVLAVPRERVELIHADASDVMTFIVSGGVSGLGANGNHPAEAKPAEVP